MALLKTANVEVEPIWPSKFLFFAALAEDCAYKLKNSLEIYAEKLGPNVKDLITNVSCSAGAAAPVAAASAAGAPAAAAAAEAKEEKKEEKEEEEEDDDMGFGE